MDKILTFIAKEKKRQQETLMLIPSENYTYAEVRKALGSCLMHKYSEGMPGARYYQGNKYIDLIEQSAIKSAKKLFGVPHANVQPYSGSPANAAVYMALLSHGDKIMGLSLDSGGHLTHGHPKITFSGKFFRSYPYRVNSEGFIDYDYLEKFAKKIKPRLIIAGISSYPRELNWSHFAKIAASVNAFLLADISHIAGLVAAGVHPSPTPYADVITTTTHKTLRGPRGALIMATAKGIKKDPDLADKLDRAVFPGLQGGPHDNQTAGIAICLKKALNPSFKSYAKKVVINSKALAQSLSDCGFRLITGGTDNHLILLDLRPQKISGKAFAIALENAGIIVNYNAIPHDPNPPANPSGIRLGTPALTTRRMGVPEMKLVGSFISRVSQNESHKKISLEVKALCRRFPVPA